MHTQVSKMKQMQLTTHDSQGPTEEGHITKIEGRLKQPIHSETGNIEFSSHQSIKATLASTTLPGKKTEWQHCSSFQYYLFISKAKKHWCT